MVITDIKGKSRQIYTVKKINTSNLRFVPASSSFHGSMELSQSDKFLIQIVLPNFYFGFCGIFTLYKLFTDEIS